MHTSTSPSRWVLPFLAGAVTLILTPTPASAQNVFPCGGGPNEQQIGVDTNGPVTVPLCVERPGASSGGGVAGSPSPPVWMPPPLAPPPRGWKQVYGAWKSFEVARIPGTDRFEWDMVISLGHGTREEALEAVRQKCMARKPIFAESSPSTCRGYIIKSPYVTVTQYPYIPYFGAQAGTYNVYDSNGTAIEGLVERSPGKWEECGMPLRPAGKCANVIAFMTNGEIPEEGKRRKRR